MNCLPLSLGSNTTVTISSTDGTDLRMDGQAELPSVKQDIFQNRPWLICGKGIVVDSTWFESVSATSVINKIRFLLKINRLDPFIDMLGLSL